MVFCKHYYALNQFAGSVHLYLLRQGLTEPDWLVSFWNPPVVSVLGLQAHSAIPSFLHVCCELNSGSIEQQVLLLNGPFP